MEDKGQRTTIAIAQGEGDAPQQVTTMQNEKQHTITSSSKAR
jgi:hypothetical protein